MKKNFFVIGLTLVPFLCLAQVGIGTMTPNIKSILDLSSTNQGFLVPRMTWQQKLDLGLTSGDAGMMVFQTNQPVYPNNYPKGLYVFDGSAWIAPVLNGPPGNPGNGYTIRWDGRSWISTSNFFNNGSSIGIGTTSPNTQLQINSSSAPSSRLQVSCGIGLNTDNHGLMLGVNNTNVANPSHGFLVHQDSKPLWFGTAAVERMRIDSVGNVGIGTTNPSAKLAVNGSVKLGTYGSVINDIIKVDMEVIVPQLAAGDEGTIEIVCPNVTENATVFVSPDDALSGLMIGYARAMATDTIEVKFINMGDTDMAEPLSLFLHMVIFQ